MAIPVAATAAVPLTTRTTVFGRLWAAQSVSLLGSQVSFLALPLTAVTLLGASPGEMGLLRAAELSPILLVGLFAGVWVDRLQRRRVIVSSDLGRAALIALVPLAAALGWLRIELLFVVGFLVGALAVFYDLAMQAYLPTLVGRDRLPESNARLELSRGVTAVLGPGLAGTLVSLLSAPIALVADVLSFVLSATLIGSIRVPEPPVARNTASAGIAREIGEGIGALWRSPLLRTLTVAAGTINLFANVVLAVLVLFLSRDLALPALSVGMVFLATGVGGVACALMAPNLARRLGLGRAILAGISLCSFGGLLVPFVDGASPIAFPLLLLAGALFGGGVSIWNVLAVSLRQALTPDHLQGRVNAPYRTVIGGVMPVGALLGGFVGDAFGVRAALVVGGLGVGLTVFLVLFSPLRSLKEQPRA